MYAKSPPVGAGSSQGRLGHFAVQVGSNVIINGGYREVAIDKDLLFLGLSTKNHEYCSRMKLHVYNTMTGQWSLVETKGYKGMEFISSGCAAAVGGSIYQFAGFERDTVQRINDIMELNLKTMCWKLIEPKGRKPTPRDKLCCWTYEQNVYFFGGFGPPGQMEAKFIPMDEWLNGWNDGLFIFDTETKEWHEVKPTHLTPCPRAAHASTQIGAKSYVFGGRSQHCRMNDLHCFDCEKEEWSGRIEVVGILPQGRSWHSFAAVSSNCLFLHGGINTNEEILADSWVFHVDSSMWCQVADPPGCSTRMWHTACGNIAEGEVYIFGGSSTNIFSEEETVVHGRSMLIFRASPLSLLRTCAEFVASRRKRFQKKLHGLPINLKKLIDNQIKARQKKK